MALDDHLLLVKLLLSFGSVALAAHCDFDWFRSNWWLFGRVFVECLRRVQDFLRCNHFSHVVSQSGQVWNLLYQWQSNHRGFLSLLYKCSLLRFDRTLWFQVFYSSSLLLVCLLLLLKVTSTFNFKGLRLVKVLLWAVCALLINTSLLWLELHLAYFLLRVCIFLLLLFKQVKPCSPSHVSVDAGACSCHIPSYVLQSRKHTARA